MKELLVARQENEDKTEFPEALAVMDSWLVGSLSLSNKSEVSKGCCDFLSLVIPIYKELVVAHAKPFPMVLQTIDLGIPDSFWRFLQTITHLFEYFQGCTSFIALENYKKRLSSVLQMGEIVIPQISVFVGHGFAPHSGARLNVYHAWRNLIFFQAD